MALAVAAAAVGVLLSEPAAAEREDMDRVSVPDGTYSDAVGLSDPLKVNFRLAASRPSHSSA